jgi:hypothetical protein
MRESAVGFGHAVGVFFFLEGSAGFVVGINDFERKTFLVRDATTISRTLNEPTEGIVQLAMTGNWEWNLVVRTTHTTRFDFEVW